MELISDDHMLRLGKLGNVENVFWEEGAKAKVWLNWARVCH